MEIRPIGRIENGFKSKFGIPRQSGLCDVVSYILFEKEYNIKEAFRGIEKYSHLWIIWDFSEFSKDEWTPTVRPPRLGGNKRVGVFATRSPHRPNSLGLSSVRLLEIIEDREKGTVLVVSGADLMNGTPIYDVKPYISFTDSHPDAVCGFADDFVSYSVDVFVSDEIMKNIPKKTMEDIISILSNDPKPSYQKDFERVYGMTYAEYEIKFRYGEKGINVLEIEKT
ncbi:MAG: tRNA (N6-threonylcarbamoyladenosine(37)-N6)-methyltransferase TrmO [Ruminococcaceae bacterium]|nr:tRNA (N6-threonylcarbamoyladenosine(37)-N6)-methyltransferase TrmO [Oscillospiraceae bacterium]